MEPRNPPIIPAASNPKTQIAIVRPIALPCGRLSGGPLSSRTLARLICSTNNLGFGPRPPFGIIKSRTHGRPTLRPSQEQFQRRLQLLIAIRREVAGKRKRDRPFV